MDNFTYSEKTGESYPDELCKPRNFHLINLSLHWFIKATHFEIFFVPGNL